MKTEYDKVISNLINLHCTYHHDNVKFMTVALYYLQHIAHLDKETAKKYLKRAIEEDKVFIH